MLKPFMRQRLTPILLFLIAAAGGFYISGIVFYLCTYLGWLPHFAEGSGLARAFMLKFQMASLIWMLGLLVGGLGAFLVRRRELRLWLLFLPFYLPLFYTALVFVYFNFLPKS